LIKSFVLKQSYSLDLLIVSF